MSKESIALALSLGEQEPTLSAGWDGEESIGLRLIRELTELREELALLRQEKLRTEMALHKLNHENDRLRAALAVAGRPLPDRSLLMLTDRGHAGDGYGTGGQESTDGESALTAGEDGGLRRELQDATNEKGMLYG